MLSVEDRLDRWQGLLEKQIEFLKRGNTNKACDVAVEIDSLLLDFDIGKGKSDKLKEIKRLYQQVCLTFKAEMAATRDEIKKLKKNNIMLRTYRDGLCEEK